MIPPVFAPVVLLVYALLLTHEWGGFNVVQRGYAIATAPLVLGVCLFAIFYKERTTP